MQTPSTPVSYWSFLSESIEILWSISSCDLLLLGEFNVNILSPMLSTQQRYLNNIISDFNLRNMITSPTRTPSQSCLNLILTPVHLAKDYKVISSSIPSLDGLTDHHLVGISMAIPLHRSPRNKHVLKYRSPPLHKADFQGLLSHISCALQTTDISCMSLDEATASWQRSILAGLDAECPEVQDRSSNKPCPPPWMTPELQRFQRQRKLIHRQSIQNPTNTYLRQQFRPTFPLVQRQPPRTLECTELTTCQKAHSDCSPSVDLRAHHHICILSQKYTQSQTLSCSSWSRTGQRAYCTPRCVCNRSPAAA